MAGRNAWDMFVPDLLPFTWEPKKPTPWGPPDFPPFETAPRVSRDNPQPVMSYHWMLPHERPFFDPGYDWSPNDTAYGGVESASSPTGSFGPAPTATPTSLAASLSAQADDARAAAARRTRGGVIHERTGAAPPSGPGLLGPILDTAIDAGRRGLVEGTTETADSLNTIGRYATGKQGFQDNLPSGPAGQPDDIGGLLHKPLNEGWSDPRWWTAQTAYGVAKSSPSLALGLAGAGLGTAAEPGLGTLVGGAAGFGFGSALQTLAPAYQRARAEGLDHRAAVDRALKETGIAAAFGIAMAGIPAVSFFGRTAGNALKHPIAEALAQIFGAQPALGTLQHAATDVVEDKPFSFSDIAQVYGANVVPAAVLTGAHGVLRSARPGPVTERTPAPQGEWPIASGEPVRAREYAHQESQPSDLQPTEPRAPENVSSREHVPSGSPQSENKLLNSVHIAAPENIEPPLSERTPNWSQKNRALPVPSGGVWPVERIGPDIARLREAINPALAQQTPDWAAENSGARMPAAGPLERTTHDVTQSQEMLDPDVAQQLRNWIAARFGPHAPAGGPVERITPGAARSHEILDPTVAQQFRDWMAAKFEPHALAGGSVEQIAPGIARPQGFIDPAVARPIRDWPPVTLDNPTSIERIMGGELPLERISTPYIRSGSEKLFDTSNLLDYPSVPQFDLPRPPSTPREIERVNATLTPERRALLLERADRGATPEALGFYNLDQIRQFFVSYYGPERGPAEFEMLCKFIAATSMRTTTPINIRLASYYYMLWRQGQQIPEPIWNGRRYVLPEKPPEGYGHPYAGLHARAIREILEKGELDPLRYLKTSSLGQNLMGNLRPVAIDSNLVGNMGLLDARGQPMKSIPREAYDFTEREFQALAAKFGLPVALLRRAVLHGGARETGLRSPLIPLISTFENSIERTAKDKGLSKMDTLRRFTDAEFPLLALLAMAGFGGASALPRADSDASEL
jgi:hypothetical protein